MDGESAVRLEAVCHSERSEESIGTAAGAHRDGFFAALRMTAKEEL
jgi:hypothetical protein